MGNHTHASEVLCDAVRRGHEIGNHGIQDAPMDWMTSQEFEGALDEWEKRVTSILPSWPDIPESHGANVKWFRPPSGLMSLAMADVLKRRGYEVVLGDVHSFDANIDDEPFHTRILQNEAQDGSILIMHCPDRTTRTQTFDVLSHTVPALRERGLQVVRLIDLFNRPKQLSGKNDGHLRGSGSS